MKQSVKLTLIFTVGALALGFIWNEALILLDSTGLTTHKVVEHQEALKYLIALYLKGLALLMIWPMAGFVSDYYAKLCK